MRSLTSGPFRVLSMQVRLSSHFTRHLVETLDRVHWAVYRFETFTYNPVDNDPGKLELQTNSVSIPRRVRERKEILTLRATNKASFHSPLVNVVFAHSLRSGVGLGDLGIARGVGASPSLPGAERHRWVNSDQ